MGRGDEQNRRLVIAPTCREAGGGWGLGKGEWRTETRENIYRMGEE